MIIANTETKGPLGDSHLGEVSHKVNLMSRLTQHLMNSALTIAGPFSKLPTTSHPHTQVIKLTFIIATMFVFV